ncbi:TonB-dependent receptor domain-containing protein [Sphingobium abikonense]|uniref:TonB-dependent receptor domain-containing protein n=1 Tax=Sphingobium abikonense TaxID=86193 RepID=UPI0035187FB0
MGSNTYTGNCLSGKTARYEVGSRNSFDLFGRRAIFNLNGFYYDYSNQVFQDLTCINLESTQTPPVCNGYSLVNRNIGASRIYGSEAEMRFKFPGHSAWTSALPISTPRLPGAPLPMRAQDFDDGGNSPSISLVGERPPLASKMNVTARLSQWFDAGPGRLDWQALLNYLSSYFLSQFNEDDIVFLDGTRQDALSAGFPGRQKGYITPNLGIGYKIKNFRFEGWASSFLNEEVSQKALVGCSLNIRFLNDASSYGTRVRVNF